MPRPPPRSTLFPYTTLFRSVRSLLKSSTAGPPTDATVTPLLVLWGAGAPTLDGAVTCRGVTIVRGNQPAQWRGDRKSTRLNSSHTVISYAVFCLQKKKQDAL